MTKTCLGSIAEIITGPFGSALHQYEYVDKGVPVIMPQDIENRNVSYEKIAYITLQKAKELSRYIVIKNDIVYARRGDIEKHAFITSSTNGAICGTGCLRVRVIDASVNPLFLSYYLDKPETRKWIISHAVGSNMPNLNTDILSNIPVELPSKEEQDRIVSVLECIEKQIANNISICSDLAAVAKLLFDYWFVQFDFPDENGKPYKSSGGKMVWNEQLKREIPEGWIVSPLSNYLNCNQNTITQNNLGEYIAYLDTGSLTENVIDQIQTINRSEGLPSRARRVVKENDILYSTVRPIQKHYGIIKHPVENMIASTGFAVLSAKQGSSYNELFYLSITSEDNLRILDTIANNSVSSYPSINSDDILNLKIALPPDITCLKGLCGKLQNCYEMIDAKHKENKELEQLRDFLLPMLMNGQVKARTA